MAYDANKDWQERTVEDFEKFKAKGYTENVAAVLLRADYERQVVIQLAKVLKHLKGDDAPTQF